MTNLITLSVMKYNKLCAIQSWHKHVPPWYNMTDQEVDQILEASKQLVQLNEEKIDCQDATEFTFDPHGSLTVTISHNDIVTQYCIIGHST